MGILLQEWDLYNGVLSSSDPMILLLNFSTLRLPSLPHKFLQGIKPAGNMIQSSLVSFLVSVNIYIMTFRYIRGGQDRSLYGLSLQKLMGLSLSLSCSVVIALLMAISISDSRNSIKDVALLKLLYLSIRIFSIYFSSCIQFSIPFSFTLISCSGVISSLSPR